MDDDPRRVPDRAAESPGPAGRLVLAATPLGDSRDASPRLRDALATADVVAAEDTRRLRSLAAALGVTVPFEPAAALYRRAWQRLRDGDRPRFADLPGRGAPR